MSPSCSAFSCRMKRFTAFFSSKASWLLGLSPPASFRFSSETSANSPSESDTSPSSMVFVSGQIKPPPSGVSPRVTHLAISASRRARLSASFRATSSSVSTGTKPWLAASLSLSAPWAVVSISSRQELLRGVGSGAPRLSAALRESLSSSGAAALSLAPLAGVSRSRSLSRSLVAFSLLAFFLGGLRRAAAAPADVARAAGACCSGVTSSRRCFFFFALATLAVPRCRFSAAWEELRLLDRRRRRPVSPYP
mmetsp:Transcript_86303/g.267228  ORF Transcript_86303/g.267228 Transcript_86303/m.267228 type:complete len:251 (-) Transcript_86303:90-842(-)